MVVWRNEDSAMSRFDDHNVMTIMLQVHRMPGAFVISAICRRFDAATSQTTTKSQHKLYDTYSHTHTQHIHF